MKSTTNVFAAETTKQIGLMKWMGKKENFLQYDLHMWIYEPAATYFIMESIHHFR
jgi:hypothetical protein